jgi:hypothetical protein
MLELMQSLYKYADAKIKSYEQMLYTGNKLAKLEDMKSTKLYLIMDKFTGSIAQREKDAKSSQDYINYLNEIDHARLDNIKARIDFKTAETMWETTRTDIAIRRTELNQLGG